LTYWFDYSPDSWRVLTLLTTFHSRYHFDYYPVLIRFIRIRYIILIVLLSLINVTGVTDDHYSPIDDSIIRLLIIPRLFHSCPFTLFHYSTIVSRYHLFASSFYNSKYNSICWDSIPVHSFVIILFISFILWRNTLIPFYHFYSDDDCICSFHLFEFPFDCDYLMTCYSMMTVHFIPLCWCLWYYSIHSIPWLHLIWWHWPNMS